MTRTAERCCNGGGSCVFFAESIDFQGADGPTGGGMELGMVFDGRAGDPNIIDEAARKKIAAFIEERVGDFRCPDHGKPRRSRGRGQHGRAFVRCDRLLLEAYHDDPRAARRPRGITGVCAERLSRPALASTAEFRAEGRIREGDRLHGHFKNGGTAPLHPALFVRAPTCAPTFLDVRDGRDPYRVPRRSDAERL